MTKKQMQEIKLNTGMLNGIFSGTYGTIWEDAVREHDNQGNEIYLEYEHKNYMQSILEAYQDHAQEVENELNIEWINSVSFTGYYSPREYNFANDQLDVTLVIDRDKMLISLGRLSLLSGFGFAEYLKENYASRDGFISFTPSTPGELVNEIVSEGKYQDQAIAAFINYLTDGAIDIETDIYEAYISNGFYGLEYEVAE